MLLNWRKCDEIRSAIINMTTNDEWNAPVGKFSDVDVLKKLATSIEYGYVAGINQTRIRIHTAG